MSVLIYDIKQSDGEASVMLDLWGMQSTPSLPLLPGPLWPGVAAPHRVPSIDQIDLFDSIYVSNRTVWRLNWVQRFMWNWIVRNRTFWSFNCE